MNFSWKKAKRQLAAIWFVGSGLLLSIIIAQVLLGRYGSASNEVWVWFFPLVMPTLTLIIGVYVADSLGKGVKIKRVDKAMFNIARGTSIFYLLVIAAPIIFRPFTSFSPIEILQEFSWVLLFLQGLASAALGAFFMKE